MVKIYVKVLAVTIKSRHMIWGIVYAERLKGTFLKQLLECGVFLFLRGLRRHVKLKLIKILYVFNYKLL